MGTQAGRLIPELRHLVRRFFGVLRARPLDPDEQLEVSALLLPAERNLFWSQPPHDQRHGLEGARSVLEAAPERSDLAQAALLHDVGKRHARLGVLGRSLASGFDLLGLPVWGRMQTYLDHGGLGAAELLEAGSASLVVDFAGAHHATRPPSIDAGDWEVLQRADS